MTIYDLNMDVTTQRSENTISYIGSPRIYFPNCKSGDFFVGKSRKVGTSLIMEVIAAKFIEDDLWSYGLQKWANVIFADEQGTVSSIMLKTESLDNFLEAYRMAYEQKKSLVNIRLQATMAARHNDKGSYFAVEFSIVGDGQFSEAIAEFREALPTGIYRVAICEHLQNDEVHMNAA